MRLAKATVFLLIMAAIFVTSVVSLSTPREPITREEAMHISKNSKLVKEGMVTNGYSRVVEVNYSISSMVEQMKKLSAEKGEIYGRVPEGHGIWQVIWRARVRGTLMGYLVIVLIDAETGTLYYETKGVAFEVWELD